MVEKIIKEQIKNESVVIFDLIGKFIGGSENGSSDLSTNPNYFDSFGQDILSASPKNINHHSF